MGPSTGGTVEAHSDGSTPVAGGGLQRRVVGWIGGRRSLPLPLIERHLCNGTVVRPIWHNAGGTPISVGRARRSVPEQTRRVVEDRDQGCAYPGCRNGRFVEIHHVAEWLAHQGCTDEDNLVSLCSTHHAGYHQGQFTIVAPDRSRPRPPGAICFTFIDTWGQVIGVRPRGLSPGGLSPGEVSPGTTPYVNPGGERWSPDRNHFHLPANSAPPNPDPAWYAAPGHDATGQDATGEDASGEDATGEGATREGATGEDATGEDATEREASEREASGGGEPGPADQAYPPDGARAPAA